MMRFSEENQLQNLKKLIKESLRVLGNWKESIMAEPTHSSGRRKGKGRRN